MLKLVNVTKSFAGKFEPILKGINLELLPGEFCIVIGSNGSGKSTLMRSIAGEYSLDNGSINVTKEMVSSVTQDVNQGTILAMTLLENMVLSKMRGKAASFKLYQQYKAEVILLIQELGIGLESYIDQPLSQLSGGQRQIIATLMAISSKPKLLLLDEHTSALDPKMQTLLMEYTAKSIKQNKITSIMITHKLDDAIRYGDRLIMLHQGNIVFDVKGKEKKTLSTDALLNLFHQHEDMILRGEE